MDGWMENGESGKKTSYFLCFSIIETHTHTHSVQFFYMMIYLCTIICIFFVVGCWFIHSFGEFILLLGIFFSTSQYTPYIGLDFVENFFYFSSLNFQVEWNHWLLIDYDRNIKHLEFLKLYCHHSFIVFKHLSVFQYVLVSSFSWCSRFFF